MSVTSAIPFGTLGSAPGEKDSSACFSCLPALLEQLFGGNDERSCR